jgi:hypothetical protein
MSNPSFLVPLNSPQNLNQNTQLCEVLYTKFIRYLYPQYLLLNTSFPQKRAVFVQHSSEQQHFNLTMTNIFDQRSDEHGSILH